MTKQDFLKLNETDRGEILSKIKSLKIRLNKLHSVHMKYLEKAEISLWANLQESLIDRTQPTVIEVSYEKTKETISNTVSAAAAAMNPFKSTPSKGVEVPKKEETDKQKV